MSFEKQPAFRVSNDLHVQQLHNNILLSQVPTTMPETVSFDLCSGLAGDPMLESIGNGEFKLNGTLPAGIIEALHNQYKYLNETCVAYNKVLNVFYVLTW